MWLAGHIDSHQLARFIFLRRLFSWSFTHRPGLPFGFDKPRPIRQLLLRASPCSGVARWKILRPGHGRPQSTWPRKLVFSFFLGTDEVTCGRSVAGYGSLAANDHLQLVRDLSLSSPIATALWKPQGPARVHGNAQNLFAPSLATNPCRAAGQWPSDRARTGVVSLCIPASERHEAHAYVLVARIGISRPWRRGPEQRARGLKRRAAVRTVSRERGSRACACQQSNTDVWSAVRPRYANSRRTTIRDRYFAWCACCVVCTVSFTLFLETGSYAHHTGCNWSSLLPNKV
jgi:hypothetical protein